jgi:hypothetical protein
MSLERNCTCPLTMKCCITAHLYTYIHTYIHTCVYIYIYAAAERTSLTELCSNHTVWDAKVKILWAWSSVTYCPMLIHNISCETVYNVKMSWWPLIFTRLIMIWHLLFKHFQLFTHTFTYPRIYHTFSFSWPSNVKNSKCCKTFSQVTANISGLFMRCAYSR